MKLQLFFLIILFSASNLLAQNNTNTNNTNTNNSEKIEIKEIKVKETKALKKESAGKMEETISPSSVVPALTPVSVESEKVIGTSEEMKVSKDQQSSYAAKKAKFVSKQTEYNQQRTQRTYNVSQETELQGLCQQVAAESPASFESLLFYYETGQYDLTRASALLKAYEMNPLNIDVRKQMLIYNFLLNKKDETRAALIDIFNANVYPTAIQNYGVDVLKSVPQNGILITHGTEDSFGALYAERVLRKREDVTIICLDWLNSPQWRANLKAQGIKLPNSDFIDVKYLEELCHLNQNRNVALSLTIPKEYFLPMLSNLYISGLVFEYKEVPTDNSLTNEVLWRTTLEKKLIETKDHDLVLNYIPMMAQLSRYYESQKQTSEKIEMDKEINEVAKSRGKTLK
jgi:hypothetical protein